jgi:hypothetical protein
MAVRIEIELYQAGRHDRKIAELVPLDGGRQAITLASEFGPLTIELAAPVAEPAPAAEPAPSAPAKKAAAGK